MWRDSAYSSLTTLINPVCERIVSHAKKCALCASWNSTQEIWPRHKFECDHRAYVCTIQGVCLFIYLFVCLFIYLSIYSFIHYLFIYVFIYLSIYLSYSLGFIHWTYYNNIHINIYCKHNISFLCDWWRYEWQNSHLIRSYGWEGPAVTVANIGCTFRVNYGYPFGAIYTANDTT